jgi:hypothetical protein
MTSQGDGQPIRYEVRLAKQIKNTIQQLHHQAAQRGQGHQFLDALRLIHDRLQRDPQQFGEPLYRLPALKLLVFQAIVSPIVVDYAVHQEEPVVFLKGVTLLG